MKFPHIFKHISDWKAQHRQKHAVEEFSESLLPLPEFFLLVVLSSVIAGFALLQGNEAIVIAAMIITPFINPLVGISLSVLVSDWVLMRKALVRSVSGMTVFFLCSYSIGKLYTGISLNNSLLSRAQSITLADMVIVIAAGIVAALALGSEKIQSRITGAAIAMSLAPPLAVAGITLAEGRQGLYENAFLLFGLNVLGIVLMSFFIFLFFGFHKKDDFEQPTS